MEDDNRFFSGCGTFLGVSFALFMLYAGLNYSGFCFAQMRYLSDEDKFRKVFERGNQQDTVFVNKGQNYENGGQRYERIKYESFEQFMESNPDCCTVRPSGIASLWLRITGIHSGEVTVMNYPVYYLDENGERKSRESKRGIILQNCGQLWYIMEPSS
ncbi:MAG: hypothetical protein F6K40_29120 [Okeania sp. SIO3I5]|uniref:hypothetical protein n=1 Tax=Okeania sp. SIO3I5 TaxID=2607805 RepID=UPI0013B5C4A8|nr:hypothetical protein [Okeania sp. SIO3I5]NEQ40081.1 hypothetical protein [Okeania sp. SIO3I5]